jgi:hypothetical protein
MIGCQAFGVGDPPEGTRRTRGRRHAGGRLLRIDLVRALRWTDREVCDGRTGRAECDHCSSRQSQRLAGLGRLRTLKRQYGWDRRCLDDVDVHEPGYMGSSPTNLIKISALPNYYSTA